MRKTLILAAALAALLAGQAQAHARLLTGSPKAGETVTAPKELRLSYSETIDDAASSVTVAAAAGTPVATGKLVLDAKDPRTVLVPITGKLTAGAYKVSWHMKSADGHATEGDFAFTVKP